MKLEHLLGNERLKGQLSAAQHLPHAIILGGPRGSGRHTLARLLAQAMVCDHPENAPCGQCRNCKRVAEGIHPDVPALESFVSSKDRDKKDIVVDTIRALRSDVFIRPNQARRKVYVIAPAETMNPNAQNALLKVLEDGPDYASFLLIAENPMSLLETIRSRCVRYDLDPVTGLEALTFLRRRFPNQEEGRLKEAIQASGGFLGQAIERLEGSGQEDPKALEALSGFTEALSAQSELALMEWSVQVQNDKLGREQLALFYSRLSDLVRDALLNIPEERDWSKDFTPAQRIVLSDLAKEGARAMERNVSPAASAGWFAVSVWERLREMR